MKTLSLLVVRLAWLIPGQPHRWAQVLLAQRRAGRRAADETVAANRDWMERNYP